MENRRVKISVELGHFKEQKKTLNNYSVGYLCYSIQIMQRQTL